MCAYMQKHEKKDYKTVTKQLGIPTTYTPSSPWAVEEISEIFKEWIVPPEGVPANWVEELATKGHLKCPGDVFRLTQYPDLVETELGLSTLTTKKLMSAIVAAQSITMERVAALFLTNCFSPDVSPSYRAESGLTPKSLVDAFGAKTYADFILDLFASTKFGTPQWNALAKIADDMQRRNIWHYIYHRHADIDDLFSQTKIS